MSIEPIQNGESGASVRAKLNTAIGEVNGLGTAAQADTGDFATAAQGQLAATALQPGDLRTVGGQSLIGEGDIPVGGGGGMGDIRAVRQTTASIPARPDAEPWPPVLWFTWTPPHANMVLPYDLWIQMPAPPPEPEAPAITNPGTITGTPQIGQTLSVTGFVATGDPTPTLAYQWQRNGAAISGATLATYTLQAADDGAMVRRQTTATNTEDSASDVTAAVAVTYAPPVASGSIAAQTFTEGTGPQTVATAGAFTGAVGGAFTVSTVAGVTINSATGVVTVQTDSVLVTTSVTVTYTNSGGSAGVTFGLTVQDAATPATPPAAFAVGQWSVSPGDTQATVTVSALPSDGGSAITGIDYRLDGGSAVSAGQSGTGSFAITGLTNDQAYDVQIRAVNAEGAGDWSDTKAVTPEAAPAPSGLSAEWLDGAPDIYGDLAHLAQNSNGTGAVADDGDPVGWAENVVE